MSYVNPTGQGVGAMAQQLMQVFDRNRDGQLTSTEFTAVLGDLLKHRSISSTSIDAAAANPGAAGSTSRRTDQLAGFNPAKFDTSQSIKYRFARAAMQFDVSSVKDKAGAEALLNQMRPAMQREGLEVLDVSKDKIQVMYEGQPLWVDVIQGASSGAALFQWMPLE
jgi:hypothetical protein